MRGIENVVFDLGGVLVDLDEARCRGALCALGMEAIARIVDPCYPAEMIGRLERGDLSFHEACDEMRREAGTPGVSDDEIADAYGALVTGIPVAKLRQVEALRERGIRTYVLSNNNPMAMRRIRKMFEADGHPMEYYFEKIYLSYKLRELKPSEAIFRKMIADSGIEPSETLFIDDGQRNVERARELGFQVYMPAPHEDFGHLFEE
ncbi:MAG: HAD family phosphatase [Alistipes sp.]|nr:HAD family phosphatase [Alistipes sp.]